MASRRVRIKGIANIPVRRKNEAATTDKDAPKTEERGEELVEKTDQQTNNIEKSDKDFNNLTDVATLNTNSLHENIVEKTQETELPSDNHVNTEISDSRKDNDITSLNNNVTSVKTLTTTTEVINDNVVQENSDKVEEKGVENVETSSQKVQPENKFARRWISKPSVKIPARRAKPELIERKKEEPAPKPIETNNVITEEQLPSPLSLPEKNTITTPPLPVTPLSVITNDDTTNISKTVIPEKVTSLPKSTDDNLKSITNSEPVLTSPLSPSKSVNRARIRPVPRLIRRSSVQGSASESEDDGRKSNRTRNDSVCSTSTIETFTREETMVAKREIKIISQRKVRYSEQSRKMSTARREFHIKFGTQTPDRKRLTMMDLIYYNPTTNPMPEKSTKSKNETSEVILNEEQAEAEIEDDPGQGSDEENIPVPQVKVGPDGEIILDEQSLVIEQTGTKKGREQLANSQIVIDDLDTGYGIYKRPKKSKDWSVTETLRFYRTLNTVGTDFSLMLSLFPNRTRRELKLKFKKEERVNRVLIDKVLMNPLDFNLSELEKQFEEEQTIVEKIVKVPKVKEPRVKRKRIPKSSSLSRQMDDENVIINVKPKKRIKMEKIPKDPYTVLECGLDSIIDSDSEDDTKASLANKDKNGEKPIIKRPTRTCRLRKPDFSSILDSDESDNVDPNEDYVEIEINGNIEPKQIKKKTKSVSFKTNNIDSEPMELESSTILAHLEPPTNKLEKFYKDLPSMEGMDIDNTYEEPEPQIETNVVIAHSEDEEPDKISIDIVTKNSTLTGSNETKVFLELKKQGNELIQIENVQNTEISERTQLCITNGINEPELCESNETDETLSNGNDETSICVSNGIAAELCLPEHNGTDEIELDVSNEADETKLDVKNGNDETKLCLTNRQDELPDDEKTKSTLDLPEPLDSDSENSVSNLIPQDIPHLEPGSLMILSSQGPNGEEIFKVYMVTPDKEKIPVDLSPDIVQSLTTSLGTDEAVMLDLPVISDKS